MNRVLTLVTVISLAATLGGCFTTLTGRPTTTTTTPSMSTGVGSVQEWCGAHRHSDSRCNPTMSAGGG